MNPVKKHPNALTALVSGVGLGSIVVYAAQHWFGVALSTNTGLYIGGLLASAALFIGRNGAVGTWTFVKSIVLHGTNGHPDPAPAPPPAPVTHKQRARKPGPRK